MLAALLAPAIAMGAGVGALGAASKGFRAGKYYNRTATIASLGTAELSHASKADNIQGLLVLARTERRANLDEISQLRAWERYNKISGGDRLLLRCLKDSQCKPLAYVDQVSEKFANVPHGERLLLSCLDDSQCKPLACADIARLSELHREVVLRQPGMNLTQANQAVGGISERVMNRHFEGTGWQRVEGQIGRSGIDGLYVKRNAEGVVREVLVVESKYNTGTLQSTNHGQQMSRAWVERKLQELRERQPDDATYRRVEQLINQGYYRARLWTMRVDNGEIEIDLHRARSASDKVDELIDDPGTRVQVPPKVIRISDPRDSFERSIVEAYKEELGKLGARR